MSPPPPGAGKNQLTIALCLIVGAVYLILRSQQRLEELGEVCRSQRNRRLEVEDALEARDGALDGALAKIKELSDRVDQLSPGQ